MKKLTDKQVTDAKKALMDRAKEVNRASIQLFNEMNDLVNRIDDIEKGLFDFGYSEIMTDEEKTSQNAFYKDLLTARFESVKSEIEQITGIII